MNRDFAKIEGRGGIDQVIGKALQAIAKQVFKVWKEFFRGYLTRKELILLEIHYSFISRESF